MPGRTLGLDDFEGLNNILPRLQEDLIELYNSLVSFSKTTVDTNIPCPIKVRYEKDSRMIVFEQKGISVRSNIPVYYCLGLEDLEEPTYLLPEDYDYSMATLRDLINSGKLLEDRTTLSPEDYGFDIYAVNMSEMWKGPGIIGSVRIVSGVSWWFKFKTKRKYRNVL